MCRCERIVGTATAHTAKCLLCPKCMCPGKARPCYGLKKARAAEAEVTFESYYVDLVGWPHVLLRGAAHQECGGRVALKETGWGEEVANPAWLRNE